MPIRAVRCAREALPDYRDQRFSGRYGAPKVVSVPTDNDCGEQIEARHTVVLSLGGSITDFILAPDTQSVVQGMVRLAFVQANLGAPLRIGIKQPVHDEE